MRSLKWIAVLCFALCALATQKSSGAATLIRVNESTIKMSLQGDAATVALPIASLAGRELAAHVKIEMVSTQGNVRASAEKVITLQPGSNLITMVLPLTVSQMPENERQRFLWDRLRYRILPDASMNTEPVEGLVALSEIFTQVFSLKALAAPSAAEGKSYRVITRAVQPVNANPVSGVKVEVMLKVEDNAQALITATKPSDADGYAIFDFDLPQQIQARELEVQVTGNLNGWIQDASTEVRMEHLADIFTSTDKPLYQPGQTLHTRVLCFDAITKSALADTVAQIKITDPEGTTVFRTTVKTSRFGVASFDWPIVEGTKLGRYFIRVEIDEGRYENSMGGQTITIGSYDLPNFTVTAKPNRAYYLPGQNAQIEVRADYLFGQPVRRGHVRVVRESERRWNYREQKWEVEEGDKLEGETDAQGRFLARLDLRDDHQDFDENEYTRFEDLTYAAYFTDATTGRTEQKRFDVRITKHAIHVYASEGNHRQTAGFPLQFYLTTFYADGSPAECEVAISEIEDDDDEATPRRLLRTVKTNRYGVAKVSDLRVAARGECDLFLQARDRRGLRGTAEKELLSDSDDEPVMRVGTDKAIYRAGESIHLKLATSQPERSCVVSVEREKRVIASQVVRLQNGEAAVTLPYHSEFDGEILITAYADSEGGEDRYLFASHSVIYPRNRDLQLDAKTVSDTYRPGEEVQVAFSTRSAKGEATESALGVVVFDKAVEERARTDQEFGSGYGFCDALLEHGGSLSGVSLREVNRLDLAKPVPDGLDLVAEVLLNYDRWLSPNVFRSPDPVSVREAFDSLIELRLEPVKTALRNRYAQKSEYPTDLDSLRRILRESGIDWESLKDPWGNLYRAEFAVQRTADRLEFVCAGADKRFDTADDFTAMSGWSWPYFLPQGQAINKVVAAYHNRTGAYIRDIVTLKSELLGVGINLDELRDRWGNPYRITFGINTTNFTLDLLSRGPNGEFELPDSESDDFTVWSSPIDYFAETRAQIETALAADFKITQHFPQNDQEFRAALSRAGIDFARLRDAWGQSYYATFKTEARYTDRVNFYSYMPFGEAQRNRVEITPITQQVNFVSVRSRGADRKLDTLDDFNLAVFSRAIAEQSSKEAKPKRVSFSTQVIGGAGSIRGTVMDASGAVVPGATVKATNQSTQLVYETNCDSEGRYFFSNLSVGKYGLIFDANGFKQLMIVDVPVTAQNITTLDVTLDVGQVSEAVTVTSDSEQVVQTEHTQVSQVKALPVNGGGRIQDVTKSGALLNRVKLQAQMETPRLREYFPETLVWQPLLETDAQGQAQLKFKLADNLTTWKMAVVASTADGQVGIFEKELRAFQPFFVEHDPPKFLTTGDEISLPVVLRNYLDTRQRVELEMKSESWFTLLGPARQSATVAAGDAARPTFAFRAIAAMEKAPQRVTAYGAKASDAIEKTLRVRPNGEEIAKTTSQVFTDRAALTVEIPETALKGQARAELKLYPNLMTHVVESVEAIMQRPYGCAEQTISSSYPSLLVLRHYRQRGEALPPVAEKARRYVQVGYERLLNYQNEDGGFSYWGRGDADVALTAYALKFLSAAAEWIAVDEDVKKNSAAWLIKQQQADGSWAAYPWDNQEDRKRTVMTTAFIARALATVQKQQARAKEQANDFERAYGLATSLKQALNYLAQRSAEIDEPYLLASYALAVIESGAPAQAARAIEKLRSLAHQESDVSYWALETNTPFYGWGLAGRIETTALAVQALSANAAALSGDDLLSRGLLFLIRNKDRYGVWYSTQATINVLDAFTLLLAKQREGPSRAAAQAEIVINGNPAATLALPQRDEATNPIVVDVSRFLTTGSNRVEILRSREGLPAAVQIVSTYYTPWPDVQVGEDRKHALRLQINFDKTEARAGDEITCRVEVERVGFRGYGMLLAEIGLPPGIDVDRASLEHAMKASEWGINQYEVLPDRVIVYLWPRAGGTTFAFKLRPRFGIKAQSAPSVLYDYYNPEARAVVAPTKFIVR